MFIVTKTIDSENIGKVCRTCLREDDKMVCLFIGPSESSLGAKLQSLSCLEITQGDGLPEKMCDRCVIRAESALLFREQCRAADQALKQAAIRVSRDKTYANITNCRLYQQNQNYVPLPYAQNGDYTNHQELYLHNRLYPPLYPPEDNLPQHMRIVESHNAYLNLSRYNPSFSHHDYMSDKMSSIIRQDDYDPFPRHDSIYNRAPCDVQCSLCNYTFNNTTQLTNHNITHNSDSVDLSSDDINIEVEENSSGLDRNTNFNNSEEHRIEDISYSKINSDCNNGYGNYSFTNVIAQNNSEITNIVSPPIIPQEQETETEIGPINSIEITRNNRFKCEICSRLFSQKSKLLAHQTTHEKKKPFECIHCGKAYSSKSKLAAHTRLHTQTNIHQCNICQKIFSYPSYLNEHLKTHEPKPTEKKPSFECVQCKKHFYFAKSYKRHMKFHTGKGLFHCDICDKLFSQKYSLKVHMLSHDPAKFHKCDTCGKSFNQKSNLVEHMRTHTKVKPFKCKICDKSFTQSSHLKNHEVSHNSVRQFQCRMCGKRFKLASHLKRHVNVHTSLKLFKCDQCDQMFSQAFSLRRHAKKHTEFNS